MQTRCDISLTPSLSTGLLLLAVAVAASSINLNRNVVVPVWFFLFKINELCFRPRELLVKIRYHFIRKFCTPNLWRRSSEDLTELSLTGGKYPQIKYMKFASSFSSSLSLWTPFVIKHPVFCLPAIKSLPRHLDGKHGVEAAVKWNHLCSHLFLHLVSEWSTLCIIWFT